MKTAMLIAGIAAVLMGLLWIGQGLAISTGPPPASCSTSGRGRCAGRSSRWSGWC